MKGADKLKEIEYAEEQMKYLDSLIGNIDCIRADTEEEILRIIRMELVAAWREGYKAALKGIYHGSEKDNEKNST